MAIKMANCGDQVFLAACTMAEIQPTARQWKKWHRREGKAWNVGRQLIQAA